jgi:4-hydroxy-tetrahydrodipicolinate reductase
VTRVAVVGAAGRMGQFVLREVRQLPELELVAALERPDHPDLGKPVAPGVTLLSDLAGALANADVAIDFSTPSTSRKLVAEAATRGVALVVATTGFSPEVRREIEGWSTKLALLLAPNFSLGVNLLFELVAEAARRLPDYDLEVLELHHSAKVDAPSGTALQLGEIAAHARGTTLDQSGVYHREGQTGPRQKGTIGMQTLRAGTSAGEHTVFLAGPGERIELTHRALSRETFASGAVRAARWIAGRAPGLYSMTDVLREP